MGFRKFLRASSNIIENVGVFYHPRKKHPFYLICTKWKETRSLFSIRSRDHIKKRSMKWTAFTLMLLMSN